jgi:hypothetical protein
MTTEPKHPRFNVLSEGQPLRCEICHQSDQFNPETGKCLRCINLPVLPEAGNYGVDVLRTFAVPERFRELVLAEVGDEAVVWVGMPGYRKATRDFFLSWGAYFLLLLLLLFGYFHFFVDADSNWGILLYWLVPFLFMSISASVPFQELLRMRRTLYVVTENRALVLVAGNETLVTSYFPNQIKKLIRVRRADGSGDLLFDDPTPKKNGQKSMDKGFYGVENVTEVERVVRERLVEKSSP